MAFSASLNASSCSSVYMFLPSSLSELRKGSVLATSSISPDLSLASESYTGRTLRSELRWRRHVDEKGRLAVVDADVDVLDDCDAAATILRRKTHVAERATLIATTEKNLKARSDGRTQWS
jgi:hypothetical protein